MNKSKEEKLTALIDDLVDSPKWGGTFIRDTNLKPELQPTEEGIEAAKKLWEAQQEIRKLSEN